jgi:hypothetical protein
MGGVGAGELAVCPNKRTEEKQRRRTDLRRMDISDLLATFAIPVSFAVKKLFTGKVC